MTATSRGTAIIDQTVRAALDRLAADADQWREKTDDLESARQAMYDSLVAAVDAGATVAAAYGSARISSALAFRVLARARAGR